MTSRSELSTGVAIVDYIEGELMNGPTQPASPWADPTTRWRLPIVEGVVVDPASEEVPALLPCRESATGANSIVLAIMRAAGMFPQSDTTQGVPQEFPAGRVW